MAGLEAPPFHRGEHRDADGADTNIRPPSRYTLPGRGQREKAAAPE